MPTSLHASVPSASSRALKSGSTQAFATSFEPPRRADALGPLEEPPVVLRREQPLLDRELADRALEDLELAELVRRLDRVVASWSWSWLTHRAPSSRRLEPVLGDFGLERVDVEARCSRARGPSAGSARRRTARAAAVRRRRAPRLVLRDHPVGPVLDDRAGLAAGERLRAGVEQGGRVAHRDPVADLELRSVIARASSRARTSSIFADSSSGVMSPLLISVLAATVAQRA